MSVHRWFEPRPRRVALLCVALAVGLAVHASWFYPFFSDDALISLRYAQRLSEGRGLTWTDGERVEGYTDLLWVLILSLPAVLGWNLILAARALGFVGALGAALCAGLAPERPFQFRIERLLSGSVFLVLAAPVAAWALAGLEHAFMLGVLALALLFAQRALETTGSDLWKASAFFAALALLRADGLVLGCTAAAGFFLALRSWRGLRGSLVLLALPALALGLQLAFRLAYYGRWVPNTAVAKVSFSTHRLLQGLEHVGTGLTPLLPALLLAVAVTWFLRREAQRRAIVLWTTAAGWWAYVALVGGDIFPGWRQVLLGLVPIAFLFSEGGAWVLRNVPSARQGIWVVAGVVAAGLTIRLGARDSENRRAKGELWEWDGLPLGHVLKEAFAAKDPLLAVDAAGALPYWSGLRSLDMLGLNDEYIARHPPPGFGRGVIGHELGDGAYVRERAPDIIAFCGSVGRKTPCFVGGHQLVRHPSFRREYAFVGVFAGPRPVGQGHVVGQLYIRREGKLGIEATEDGFVIPSYFFAASAALAHLEGKELVTRVSPTHSGKLEEIELEPGTWTLESDNDALEWSFLCGSRSATVLAKDAPVSIHLERRTRVGILVGTRTPGEQRVGAVRLRKSAAERARQACSTARQLEARLSDLPAEAIPGGSWNDPRNVLFDRRGMLVALERPSLLREIELSTDNNDTYLLKYVAEDGSVLGESHLAPKFDSPGMLVHRVTVPDAVRGQPVATLELLPKEGDGAFSLGHLVVTRAPETEGPAVPVPAPASAPAPPEDSASAGSAPRAPETETAATSP